MDEIQVRKKIHTKLTVALIFFLVGVLFVVVNKFVLEPEYHQLQEEIETTAKIQSSMERVEKEKEGFENTLKESGKRYEKLTEKKDAYISYLGEVTMANKLNINKMTVGDIVPIANNGLSSMKASIELQGDLKNIKNLVQQLYNSEIVNRINSFSYRLQSEANQQFIWMWRDIDGTSLVPWWDVPVDNPSNNSSQSEEDVLSADDVLEHGTALCFLEIEFLGLGG